MTPHEMMDELGAILTESRSRQKGRGAELLVELRMRVEALELNQAETKVDRRGSWWKDPERKAAALAKMKGPRGKRPPTLSALERSTGEVRRFTGYGDAAAFFYMAASTLQRRMSTERGTIHCGRGDEVWQLTRE